MARRKNKQTRKYKPRNEFRRNNSPTAGGHYNYVFGETETHYKSLGLTTHPREDIRHYPLHKNPNPKDDRQAYLQLKVLNTKKNYFKPSEKNWSFAKEDMPVVRHRIKDYSLFCFCFDLFAFRAGFVCVVPFAAIFTFDNFSYLL